MNASKKRSLTYPHEYAPVLSGLADEKPVIVAGQAVNLWAAVYLPRNEETLFGSVDMDVLATPRIVRWMPPRFHTRDAAKDEPCAIFEPRPPKPCRCQNFMIAPTEASH